MRRGANRWWGAVGIVVVAAVTVYVGGTDEPVPQPISATSVPVDEPGAVVLDAVRPVGGDHIEVVGWRPDGGAVEILADGEVVATVQADQPRPDVAVAMALTEDRVGFSATVEVTGEPLFICAATPDALPASGGCNRPVLDLDLHRAVALYGVPGAPALGALGDGSARSARRRLQAQARPYESLDRPVVPVFEIIATVAQGSPGSDGDFSHPIPTEDIWEYLAEIRRVGGHVVLDFQTGRGEYLDQMMNVEELIAQPDVHVALDPEWDMLSHQRPAEVVGHTRAGEINEIMGYIAGIVTEHRLPPKLVIVHQFQEQMIRGRQNLAPPNGVQLALQMDGHGPPSLKTGNYRYLSDRRFYDGFKLFYQRDVPLLGPDDVLRLRPVPDYVSYQ